VAGKDESFTPEERKAMRERAKELKNQNNKAAAEADVMAKIAEMSGTDKAMAQKIHDLVKSHAPDLDAKTWYGMPAYAKDGKTILFFQSAGKFKVRYATLGFSENAKLDQGQMWPNAYALTSIDAATEKEIIRLIKLAVS
jgi:uncharacterized protein YdhG (YjbR/CyaY superfamily)